MPFRNSDWLPTEEELTVEEINLSSAPLRAAAHHFGKYCDEESKEYMLCSSEEKDPRKCVNEGKALTRCGMRFFREIKANCADSFTGYWKCLDDSSWDMKYKNCRATQAEFDKCVLQHLNQERPPLGYFAKVRLHDTKRQKPLPPDESIYPPAVPEPVNPYSKDAPPPITDKYQNRNNFGL